MMYVKYLYTCMIESQPLEILRVLAIELKYIYYLMYNMYPFHVIENCYNFYIIPVQYARPNRRERLVSIKTIRSSKLHL